MNLPEGELFSILKLRCMKNQDQCALSRDFWHWHWSFNVVGHVNLFLEKSHDPAIVYSFLSIYSYEHFRDLLFNCFTFVISNPPDVWTSLNPWRWLWLSVWFHNWPTWHVDVTVIKPSWRLCNFYHPRSLPHGHVLLGIESDWFLVTQLVLICIFAHVDVFLRNMYDM